MTTKQLTIAIRTAFYHAGGGVTVTAENLAAARRLRRGMVGMVGMVGSGGIDCRRWGYSGVLGYDAWRGDVTQPEIGDMLVWQCGQVG